jgi:hypothetical protein
MINPLITRPPYGTRTPVAVAELPSGGPADHGIPLDSGIPGEATFAKPVDDSSTSNPERKDESPYRRDTPRDLPKDRDRVDVKDNSDCGPSYEGLGDTYNSPKTKYPYRDGIPNAHNASYSYCGANEETLNSVMRILSDHCGESGTSEGAVETLERIIAERDKAEFVAGMWALKTARVATVSSGVRVKVASNLEDILEGLDPQYRQRSNKCTSTLKRADISNLRWIFSVDCGNGAKVVKLGAIRNGRTTKFSKLDLELACSCPAWQWLGPEFHAHSEGYMLGSAVGTASTPDIRDPERDNRVCKHVVAVLSMTRNWEVPVKRKK